MEEFVVYILYSEKFGKTYVGFTSHLLERFKSHNSLGKKGYTLHYRPWEVVLVEFFVTKQSAMEREKYYKSGRGREAIKSLITEYKK